MGMAGGRAGTKIDVDVDVTRLGEFFAEATVEMGHCCWPLAIFDSWSTIAACDNNLRVSITI